MKINIVNKSSHNLPSYETLASAGMDLRAHTPEPITLQPQERELIKTGLFMELPIGVEAQVRPRSGLALKKGISVLNAPGTIDADYRGEIGVILINLSSEPFTIASGDRIAQLVIQKVEEVAWEESDELDDTERGLGGFGHSGR